MRAFLSHIAEEAPLALALKDWIESSFAGQCEVFVSSDKDDIPAGSRWLEQIDNALEGASVFIVLCSPTSISRPWINFEAGCGWIRRVPILPICQSRQEKANLPAPLSVFQALELDDRQFVRHLLAGLASHFQFKSASRGDEVAFKKALSSAISSIQLAPPSTARNETPDIPNECVEVLKIIGNFDQSVTSNQIADRFQIPIQRTRYALDVLLERKLVQVGYNALG